jgi:RNA polymerase sigma factor (sigma-70 family)
MENVFGSDYTGDTDDAALVVRAKRGERDALEALIQRHQPWIYNIVLRMVGNPQDAEDVSQEVLLKLLTRLSTFERRSSFRTWLYRIVVNHVLTLRRRPWERLFPSFEHQAGLMDGMGLAEPAVGEPGPEEQALEAETRVGCMTAMLLCLDRVQRMALVLGAVFGVDSALGGVLMDTSPDNYRQILSRARKQLGNFMNDRCGLMNESNPCRCARKTQAAIRAGLVDPEKLRFRLPYVHRVRDFAARTAPLVENAIEGRVAELYRDHPLYEPPDLKRVLAVMLRRGDLGDMISFH